MRRKLFRTFPSYNYHNTKVTAALNENNNNNRNKNNKNRDKQTRKTKTKTKTKKQTRNENLYSATSALVSRPKEVLPDRSTTRTTVPIGLLYFVTFNHISSLWAGKPSYAHLAIEHVFTINYLIRTQCNYFCTYSRAKLNRQNLLNNIFESLKHILKYLLWDFIRCFGMHTCSGAKCTLWDFWCSTT